MVCMAQKNKKGWKSGCLCTFSPSSIHFVLIESNCHSADIAKFSFKNILYSGSAAEVACLLNISSIYWDVDSFDFMYYCFANKMSNN